MSKIKYYHILYYLILILLLWTLFIYDKGFFLDLTSSGEVLQQKFKIMFYLFQISILSLIFLMVGFKNVIFDKKKEILLLLFVLGFSFTIMEIGSRFYVCNFYDPDFRDLIILIGECDIDPIFENHHYLNYKGRENYESKDGLNIHNSLGFRGPEILSPKPKGVYRIVTIGGSTTYSSAIKEWRKDFARQLERNLIDIYEYEGIEVVNAGMGGYTSWESLINLEFNVLELEPDLIIVYQGANDMVARIVNPDNYKGDNSGLRKQWDVPKTPLIFKPMFVRLLLKVNVINLQDIVNNADSVEGSTFSGFIESLNSTPLGALEQNDPVFFKRNLRSIIAISREFDAEIFLSTIALNEEVGEHTKLLHFKQGIEENNYITMEVGLENNVTVYDFASDMSQDVKLWNDGIHLNEKGVEIKGKLFAKFIKENGIIDKDIENLRMDNGIPITLS